MQYHIVFTGVQDRKQLHEALKAGLGLPEHYGRNMDALWDSLTEIETPCGIHIRGINELPDGIREAVKAIFREAVEWHAADGRKMAVYLEGEKPE